MEASESARQPADHAELRVGTALAAQHFTVDPAYVQQYLDSIGDTGFAPFAAAVQAEGGDAVAPLTLFDRHMSTYLARNPALVGRIPPFGVHARQVTRHHAPLRVGRQYVLQGEVLGVEARPGLDRLSVACRCVDVEAPADVLIDAVWVRAQGFRDDRYGSPSPTPRRRPDRGEWLGTVGADPTARYPAPGALVEGPPRRISQVHLDRFLGPGPNFHTDLALARRLGFQTTVAAGVMATQVECDLYRDLFGLALFDASELDVRYVTPIPEGSVLTPISVVQPADGDEVSLCTAVCTGSGLIVTTSRLTITP